MGVANGNWPLPSQQNEKHHPSTGMKPWLNHICVRLHGKFQGKLGGTRESGYLNHILLRLLGIKQLHKNGQKSRFRALDLTQSSLFGEHSPIARRQ